MNPTSSVSDWISGLSNAGASWYNGVTQGTPVIPSSQVAIANQLAINQAEQLQLAQTNPTLSGVLANPSFMLILGFIVIGLVAYLILR